MLPAKLTFVDVETTGAGLTQDRIIEIGLIRVEAGQVVESFQSLINPESHVSPFVSTLTGIRAEDLEYAPTFSQLKEKILQLCSDSVLVAHNARFDYSRLRYEFRRAGILFSSRHLCTVKLFRGLCPHLTHHNLDSLIGYYGLDCPNRHRAFDDAKVLWDFLNIVSTSDPEKVAELVSVGLRRPSVPPGLSIETLEKLPESPGVYIFYGSPDSPSSQLPLYVGKSINIKDRVMSHFSADLESDTEMKLSRQVAAIEYRQTAGELGALLTESELIKTLQPLYNRQLRIRREMLTLTESENAAGYKQASLQTVQSIPVPGFEKIIGLFSSKKQAESVLTELAQKHSLCPKLLGLEKTRSACFWHRLGKCAGACVGKENPLRYHLRFIAAFSRQRFKAWPFSAPIVITEQDEFTGKKEAFVVDKWCILGRFTSKGDLQSRPDGDSYKFDVDVYKILLRYTSNLNHHKNITPYIVTAPSEFRSAGLSVSGSRTRSRRKGSSGTRRSSANAAKISSDGL